jgi:hypothetical protein
MTKFAGALLFFYACSAAPQSFRLVARVFNQTGVPSEIVKHAETEASCAAQKCGFAMDWIDCLQKWSACSSILGSSEFVFSLRVRPDSRGGDGSCVEGGKAWLGLAIIHPK